MDMSRSSTPEAPPQDLWSSILDSVSSSRSIPAKQILLLGQPSSGKSTIASALLQKPVSDEQKVDQRSDFAIGYDFADIIDTLARLSVYTVPSSASSYTALLPHFLPPRTALLQTLVIITLDWTRPWTFVEELETWLSWVEAWSKGDGSRELEIIREESRERLQSHLQHYTESSSDSIPSNSTLSNTILPLGPGTLTHNSAGVPIIVACTKADLIDDGNDMVAGTSGMGSMVKGKGGEWEEQTDGVMQVLRTICLKYGAALFYTTPQPANLQVLRQYALHLLFMPPAPSPAMAASTEVQAPVRNIFPFNQKPNTLDRDRIVVPAGWDSWGKISVLRDGFDAKMWGEAWERDLDTEDEQGEETGAKKAYANLVPDQGSKPPPLPPFNNPTPEQAFLAKNYDENSKKGDRDPRGAFRNPQDFAGAAAGIVGPLGSSSFSLPNVERALSEMETGVGGIGITTNLGSDAARRLAAASRTGPTAGGRATGLSALGTSTAGSLSASRSPVSPSGSATSPSGSGGASQHEVLQNFFQSLLSTKDRGTGGSTRSSPAKPNGNSNVPEES
ncbi:Cytoplasmic dynein 1 light intermediate chain 2 [Psilocybe cubensis]|uniref:Cytoplasmic dynein 1 light intermediate chain 2 n=2 Tax=Psilocybe cubensis TaxID=181762 RepID=A0ACB8H4B8_PSICU|nr:Cytoplasmic dynein 1 light intermediate chain 2 [Psilocybe cubensis]KAH9482492.1 Cytoplasmic dynein 1 light intermediate chain 2 [Psilocybe cubensis]